MGPKGRPRHQNGAKTLLTSILNNIISTVPKDVTEVVPKLKHGGGTGVSHWIYIKTDRPIPKLRPSTVPKPSVFTVVSEFKKVCMDTLKNTRYLPCFLNCELLHRNVCMYVNPDSLDIYGANHTYMDMRRNAHSKL